MQTKRVFTFLQNYEDELQMNTCPKFKAFVSIANAPNSTLRYNICIEEIN